MQLGNMKNVCYAQCMTFWQSYFAVIPVFGLEAHHHCELLSVSEASREVEEDDDPLSLGM